MPDADTFFNVDLGDVDPETKPVEPGIYKLRFLGGDIRTSKNGNRYLNSRFAIVEDDSGVRVQNAGIVFDIKMLPTDEDEIDQKESRQRGLKQILVALGENGSSLDLDTLTGNLCTAMLDKENDPQYGERNRIRRFLLDK